MSRPRLLCAFVGLGLGLLFYLAYRSDQTLSNRLVEQLYGPVGYLRLKAELRHWLPSLLLGLQGCIPSALWCFIGTSLLGGWKIRLGRERVLPLAGLPPVFNAWWESVQCIGWTDGHADWLDVVAGIVGWLVVQVALWRQARPAEEISIQWGWRTGVVAAGFACMGLADVWN